MDPLKDDPFPEYAVDGVIFDGDPTRIYRARRRADDTPVMLKALRDERSACEAAAFLTHEYEMTRRLEVPSVIRVFGLEHQNNRPVIVLEDFGGNSLDNIARQRRLPLTELLEIAIQLARGLAEIHAANIIHKDINPSNIVYSPETGVVKFIDFGISSYLTREQAALASPEIFEGSLPYISPEQTGRMNRPIDYRTDFYSLGVTLYELLTGRPLFIVSEPIEWFHCHIAKKPKPPIALDPSIPRGLSELVMKLLAKTAEERYQSAQGLLADLEHCLDELEQTGGIHSFVLGTRDIPDRFQVSQRLYGRDREIARLLASFRGIQAGESRMILVSGYSGIGKTCLIKEIYKPITERRGHFISGKFEQFHRNVPYLALTAALHDLLRQLLTEPEEQLALWRERILAALGSNGQLMIDIISELELVIGPQPEVPKLQPLEAEQRFHRVFRQFIQVFCRPDHPLTIFLDDLQWADSASMKLLDLLSGGDSGITHLLLIGAYRDNEVDPAHPVALWLKELRQRDAALEEIHLSPLTWEDLSHLLADTLWVNRTEVAELAGIVGQKTAGNPFFIEEFLKELHDAGLIVFSHADGCWTWDMGKIRSRQMTDNVVVLMADKLRRLSPDTRNLLELAACIGYRFPVSILALVSEQAPAVVGRQLKQAIAEGLIAPLDEAYQLLELEQVPETIEVTVEFAFAHDRIQQAAYANLEEARRGRVHLQIGRLLRNGLSAKQQERRLFEIVDHFNLALELITDPAERDQLCRLNLSAGKRAKWANAYQQAFVYLQQAMALLPQTAWQDDYPLALELHNRAAEAACIIGAYEAMEEILASGFENAKTLLDRVDLHLVKISACLGRGELKEAVRIAKPLLRQLGHRYPAKPRLIHVIAKLIRLRWRLHGRTMEELRSLPEMTDPQHLAAMRIGKSIGGAAMFVEPHLMTLMVIHGVMTTVAHGHNTSALTAYPAYAAILSESLGQPERGRDFGCLALDLTQRFQAGSVEGRVNHIYNALVRHWNEPVGSCLDPLQESFRLCIENGDFEFAAHAITVRMMYAFDAGMHLEHLSSELEQSREALKPLNQGLRIHMLDNFRQRVDNLLGNAGAPDHHPARLKGRFYDVDEMLPLHEHLGDQSLLFADVISQMLMSYLFGDYEQACVFADRARSRMEKRTVGIYIAPHRLLDSLIRTASLPDAEKKGAGKTRRRLIRQVKQNLSQLKQWAAANPDNCLNKQRLVEAELMRVSGKDFRAHELYEQAIQLAREQGFVHEEALAYELCGGMHLAAGRRSMGEPYLARAREVYGHWGARAKAADLERRFPQIAEAAVSAKKATTTIGTPLAHIDIASVIKALKAIAEEKAHSRMVAQIIATALEFAGAQRGLLLLRGPDAALYIEAEASVDGDSARILQSLPINLGELSRTVVTYVARTRESLVIHDAQRPGEHVPGLNQEPYIRDQEIRSILCLPILIGSHKETELIGMLYLENNRATDVFTRERFETLELICLSAAGRLELSRKAVVDGLTELFNHEYFQNLLSQEFATARRHGRELALLFIDIDHFKHFNDSWGHQVGDQVLREIAGIIKDACRVEDTVARYGGEEIAVILPMTGPGQAGQVAERIRAAVENHRVMHDGNALQVTISLGLAHLEAALADKDELISRADDALYRSKAGGRNRLTAA